MPEDPIEADSNLWIPVFCKTAREFCILREIDRRDDF